jgi:uncharacterized protein YegP (UPF0339 family)
MVRTGRWLLLAVAVAVMLAIGASAVPLAAQQKDKDKDKKGKKEETTAVFELYKDTADEFRWRMKTGEGTLLGTSGKGYKTKEDCREVIDTIKREAAKAKVEDLTKK